MHILIVAAIYYAISKNCITNEKERELYRHYTDELQRPIVKVAFDTRRINQNTEIIPRRGLQNYHRSEEFINASMAIRVDAFIKLQKVLNSLKEKYIGIPEWKDSYARILSSTVDNTLRSYGGTLDISDTQPAMGSIDYLEELLNVRYRLTMEDIQKMSENELQDVILKKDESLVYPNIVHFMQQPDKTIAVQGYDTLIDKLFGIKASADNPEVEHTVTITIRDSLPNKIDKKGS